MGFGRGRKTVAVVLCLVIILTLFNTQTASAAPCAHNRNKKVRVEPTCGKAGSITYYCSKCDTKTGFETIPATGNHSWGSWITDKSASCTEGGSRHRVCSGCGALDTDPLYAYGHDWSSWRRQYDPDCVNEGKDYRTCDNCGRRETRPVSELGHSMQGQIKKESPTCTKDGFTVPKCSRCGAEVGSRTVLPATGHTWGAWIRDTDPTCETDGTQHRYCSVCGARDDGTIRALGHQNNGQVKRVDKTCTTDGYTVTICSRCGKENGNKNIIKAGHVWGDWLKDSDPGCETTGTKHRICSACGARENGTIDALGHLNNGQVKRVNKTCTKDGYTVTICSRCGKETGTPNVIKASHNWNDWVTDTEAKCEADGTKHRTCKDCGKREDGTITKLGHLDNGEIKKVEPTCSKAGYKVKVCSRCKKELEDRTTIKATGVHTWKSWVVDTAATCEKAGTKHHECSGCGKKETETIAKLGHLYEGKVKRVEATCVSDGYSVVVCSRCGKEQGTRTVIKATGNHTWGDWVVDKAATCEAAGTKHRTCKCCSKKETGTIPKLGHLVQGQVKSIKPTCTQDGYTIAVCSRCGKEMGNRVKIAAKHTWGDWIIDTKASCDKAGSKHRVCTVCGKRQTESIDKLKHVYNGVRRTVDATCTKDGYTAMICSRCGAEQQENRTVIKAKGHSWGDWITDKKATCEADGSKHRVCKECGEKETGKIKKLGHLVDGQVRKVDATCTKDGYSVVVCSRCGKDQGDKNVISAHHVWGSWIVDENASCAKAGSKHRVCSKCKKTETEVIPISDKHSINGTIKTVEATCGKDGYKVMVCSVCGKEQGDRTILHKTGKHTWQKWVTDTDATCEGTGTKHRICDVCGEREDGKIKELGHLVEGQTKKIYPAKGEPARVVVVCSRCGKVMSELSVTDTPSVKPKPDGQASDPDEVGDEDEDPDEKKDEDIEKKPKVEDQDPAENKQNPDNNQQKPDEKQEKNNADGQKPDENGQRQDGNGQKVENNGQKPGEKGQNSGGTGKNTDGNGQNSGSADQKTTKPDSKPGSENNESTDAKLTVGKSSITAVFSSVSFSKVPWKGKDATVYLNGVQGDIQIKVAGNGGDLPEWLDYTVDGDKIVFHVDQNSSKDFRSVVVVVTDTKTQKSINVKIYQLPCSDEKTRNEAERNRRLQETKPEDPNEREEISHKPEYYEADTDSVLVVIDEILNESVPTPKASTKPEQTVPDSSPKNGNSKPEAQSKPDSQNEPDTPPPSVPSNTPTPTPTPTSTPTPTPTPIGLRVEPSRIELGSYEASAEIVKVSGYSKPYDVVPDDVRIPEWLTVEKDSDGEPAFTVVVSENPGDEARIGTVGFEDKNTGERAYLEVVQSGHFVTVAFDENRDEYRIPDTITYTVGEHYELPEGPSDLDGKAFIGWYTRREGGEEITNDDVVNGLLTTLYARYDSEKVKVEFVVENTHGELIPSRETVYVSYGEKFGKNILQIANPKAYKILVWKDINGNYYDEDTVVSTRGPIVLYPVWGEKDQYLIIFDGNGNRLGHMDNMFCRYDEEYDWPAVGYDDGVGFVGWGKTRKALGGIPDYDLEDIQGKFCNIVGKDKGHIFLYALWRESKYVTYYDPIRQEKIGTDVLPHIFSPRGLEACPKLRLDGLHFIGWVEEKDFKGLVGQYIKYGPSSEYVVDGLNDLTLYPMFETEEEGQKFIVFYDDKSENDVVVKLYDDNCDSVTMPYKTMGNKPYLFGGWRSREIVKQKEKYLYEANDSFSMNDMFPKGVQYVILDAIWYYTTQELTLHLNYDDKTEEVLIYDENYTLPIPERRGYAFDGWEDAEHKELFEGGSHYSVIGHYSDLYARWRPVSFTIEYYDGITGDLISRVEAHAGQTITESYISINGLDFKGWTLWKSFGFYGRHVIVSDDDLPDALSNKADSGDMSTHKSDPDNKLTFMPGEDVVNLPLEAGTIQLYSYYRLSSGYANGTTVIYLPNKGYSAPGPSHDKIGAQVRVPSHDMKRYRCEFNGWLLLDIGGVYYEGDVINLPDKEGSPQVYFMMARWTSDHKVEVDPDWPGQEKIDLSDDYQVGDFINTADLSLTERPGYYIQGWKTNDGAVYPLDSYVSVPDRDLTLIPIWAIKEFRIKYHNGFAPDEYVSIYADSVTRYTFDLDMFPWIEVPGYKFLGWTMVNRADLNMPPVNIDKKDIITPNRTEVVYLDGDLDLYSCYKELDVPDGQVMVVYNPMGGVGGPGVVCFDIGEEYNISEIEPTRDGYKFLGWSYYQFDTRVNCVANDKLEREEADNKVYLFAVWSSQTTNGCKKELQSLYGKDVMPDFMFENEYESYEWEKINDYCYFVIKTRNLGTSDNDKHMVSDYMIMEYRCGTWYLSGMVGSASVKKQVEYDILTHHNNVQGRLGIIAMDAAFTMAEQIPIAKTMLAGEEIGALFIDMASNWGLSESHDAAVELTSRLASTIYKQLKSGHDDEHFIADVMDSIWPHIVNSAAHGIEVNEEFIIDSINVIGGAVIANANNLNPQKLQATFKNVGASINKDAKDWWDSMRGAKAFDCLDEIGDLSGAFSSGLIDLGAFVWSNAWEQIKITVTNKHLDPFGDYDLALQTFQSEVEKKFGPRYANQIPDVINKIYRAYFGQN